MKTVTSTSKHAKTGGGLAYSGVLVQTDVPSLSREGRRKSATEVLSYLLRARLSVRDNKPTHPLGVALVSSLPTMSESNSLPYEGWKVGRRFGQCLARCIDDDWGEFRALEPRIQRSTLWCLPL
jgi:hypothetical protein